MNNKEYLIEWSKLEDKQLTSNLEKFQDEVFWVTEVFLLIQKFERSLKVKLNFQTSVGLVNMVVKDIHLTFLSIFRGHFSLAYKNIRSAIEATTFINAIKGDENKANIWSKKELLDQNDEEYKKLLIEGRQGDLGKKLKDKFNFASEQSHANFIKFLNGRKSELFLEQKIIKDTYSYFDEDDDWFIAHTHQLIGTIFLILNVFEDVFRNQIEDKEYKQKLQKKFSEYLQYTSKNLDRILVGPKLNKRRANLSE
ncbi:MAG: hypothetical protein WC884_01390 [Candidatus Paceibacterota bacterium]